MEIAAQYAKRREEAVKPGAPLAVVSSYLRFCRLQRVGSPSDVFDVASKAIDAHGQGGLGGDYFNVLEQAVVAGSAAGGERATSAEKYYKLLRKEFPTSARVSKLAGLIYEGRGDTSKALETYADILADHPTHAGVWKRKVTALAAAGREADAVKELSSYLETYGGDADAVSSIKLLPRATDRANFSVSLRLPFSTVSALPN